MDEGTQYLLFFVSVPLQMLKIWTSLHKIPKALNNRGIFFLTRDMFPAKTEVRIDGLKECVQPPRQLRTSCCTSSLKYSLFILSGILPIIRYVDIRLRASGAENSTFPQPRT